MSSDSGPRAAGIGAAAGKPVHLASGPMRALAVRSVRRAQGVLGQATRSARVLPSVLIVGAQRGGTTSMFKALRQHPAMLAPVTGKGVHFFDLAYERGLNWYRGNFPLQRTVDAASSTAGIAARTFESSPYYLWHPHVAARIAADLDEIRCLVLVRDPVERAYSAHEHETRKGFETETFERALELEASRLAGADRELAEHPLAPHYSHQHHAYRARGIYAPQVERLAGELGKDRVLVVDSQAFFETPETEMAEVWSFLGLGEPAGIVYERHNARHRNPMDLGVRAELEEFFTPHDADLTSWLRRVPSWRQDRPESRPSPDQRQRTDGPDQ